MDEDLCTSSDLPLKDGSNKRPSNQVSCNRFSEAASFIGLISVNLFFINCSPSYGLHIQ